MSTLKPDAQTRPKARDGRQEARRGFLGTVLGLTGGLALLAMLPRRKGRRPLSLHEADYYKPHDHAG